MRHYSSLVCFIVCDSGPATHFADFAESLASKDNIHVKIYASGPAFVKLQNFHFSDDVCLSQFTLDGLTDEEEEKLAIQLLNVCVLARARSIVFDIANSFDVKLQQAFNDLNLASADVRCWCYYDNSEEYVPGGYSVSCKRMIERSENILFANLNLSRRSAKVFSSPNNVIDLNEKNVQGIGYYPVELATNLGRRRHIEREALRAKYGWNNSNSVFVYFGGNNEVYYEQAFPQFLASLSQVNQKTLERTVFLLHQHPAAKKANRDGLLFQDWSSKNDHIQAMLSPVSSDEAQVVADGVLYYQTSMAPQFALIGLPVMQVGHEIYEDVLVKHHLCVTATNSTELIRGLDILQVKSHDRNHVEQKRSIYDAIGYTPDWTKNLQNVILNLDAKRSFKLARVFVLLSCFRRILLSFIYRICC